MLLPVLLIFVHAIVLRRFAPAIAENLPFVSLSVGALAYATFLAVVAPVRRR